MEHSSTQQQIPHLTKKLSDLLADAINLATYAVEIGRLPETVSFSDLFRMWEEKIEQGKRLSDRDVDYLQYCYQQLEEELAPVSAISLRATDTQGAQDRKDYLNTEAGKHVKRMWFIAFGILGLIIGINLFQYSFEMFAGDWATSSIPMFEKLTVAYWLIGALIPFTYGAFGATVRMLRITETRLRERSFDPRRLAEHRNRLVLGTLSGGVVVLVVSTGGVGEMDVKLTEAALGFLAGYSIDLLFSLLDRLVKAISPDEAVSDKSTATVIKRIKEKSFAEREIEKAQSAVKESGKEPTNVPSPQLTTVDELDTANSSTKS